MSLRTRDALIALSCANLWYIGVWSDLLPGSPTYYFLPTPPSASTLYGVIIGILALAAAAFAAVTLARRTAAWPVLGVLARIGLVVLLLNTANMVRRELPVMTWAEVTAALGPGRYVIVAVAAIAIVGIALSRRAWRAVPVLALLLVPFAFYTIGTTVVSALRYDPNRSAFAVAPLATPKPPRPGVRVVWHVFDGLDQRMVFGERPASIDLPEFDRLRAQSITGSNAYTASISTVVSMPALITGQAVVTNHPAGANDSVLTYRDGRVVRWSQEPTVFSRAQTAGFNTGVVGYALPYCRILASSLTRCETAYYWQRIRVAHPQRPLWESLTTSFVYTIAALPKFLPRDHLHAYGPRRERELLGESYTFEAAAAKVMVPDKTLGLVFVHWPVPHEPGIFDRQRGVLSAEDSASYLDNLVLVDRVLGDMRREMEANGTWDSSAVVVTGDHSWRESALYDGKIDRRTPFLLKLPGQTTPVAYDAPFENFVAGDLLLRIMASEITTPEQAVAWLAQHAPPPPAP